MFLSLTCCGIWLFVDFCVGDSDDSIVSIRQRSHIKSIFIIMLHQTWNPRYSRHIRIIYCVSLDLYLLAINLEILSSFYVFSSLIFMLKCKSITVLNI